MTLAAYQAMAASQSRNYDRTQDISPRQMAILLDVSERTGTSLGQVLATGEFESADTWNDHVRPTLKNGSLGSATGVWQFIPATFHRIIRLFGAQLLAASEADAATGRQHMDLGDGPFDDAKVRSLIAEAVDGKRGVEDEELQLLRHNFAVLAFAKHYLSVDSGAATPEEDYLFHFLGARQGRQILTLARGAARDTLCVKPVEVPVPALETSPDQPAVDGLPAPPRPESAAPTRPLIAAEPAVGVRIAPAAPPLFAPQWGPETRPESPSGARLRAMMQARADLQAPRPQTAEPALAFPSAPDAPPPVSAQWGLPANSATVSGNLGMFYRDGKGQTQPYTWAEFMQNLARRVRAASQPALVRAKYGVGFGFKGGDLPERAFNPEHVSDAAAFRYENEQTVLVAEALVTGPLGRDETRQYRQRLAALLSQGDDQPLATLPPAALSALHHLRLLPANVQEVSTSNPQVQKALHDFRARVGKDEPDDPAHFNLLMPTERIALEIYDQRLARYAALQAGQQTCIGNAPDLNRIRKMPAGLQRLAAPEIAALQTALAAHGLLTRPTRKSVWRDKKRIRHVDYQTLPFAGTADKATVAALSTFQWRNGLRKTEGVVDAQTLKMLGLPPMGPELFLPLSGPQCAVDDEAGAAPWCAGPTATERAAVGDFCTLEPKDRAGWNRIGSRRMADWAHRGGTTLLRSQPTQAPAQAATPLEAQAAAPLADPQHGSP